MYLIIIACFTFMLFKILYMYSVSNEVELGPEFGGVSLLTVPLTGYNNGKIVNCLFLKTAIRTALS